MTGQTRAQPEQLVVRERKAGVSEYTNRAGRVAIEEKVQKSLYLRGILYRNLVRVTLTKQEMA